jgi:hypothetical protein
MLRKLFAIVGRYTKHGLFMGLEQHNYRLGNSFSALTVNLCGHGEIRYALNNGH